MSKYTITKIFGQFEMKTRAQLILIDLTKNTFQYKSGFCYFTPQVDISLPNIINSLILSLQVIKYEYVQVFGISIE